LIVLLADIIERTQHLPTLQVIFSKICSGSCTLDKCDYLIISTMLFDEFCKGSSKHKSTWY